MSQTKLPHITMLSPNYSKGRSLNGKAVGIDTITIHCFVGQVSAKRGGECFASPSRGASCHYVVAYDGQICQCVLEENRSWCTGGTYTVNGITGSMNDQTAVTIEVACDAYAPYAVTSAAMKALIELCADICERNNIKRMIWKGDKTLIGKPSKQNMTVHRWFAAKACPGDYLYNKMGYIATEANKIIEKHEKEAAAAAKKAAEEAALKAKAAGLNLKTPYRVKTTKTGVRLFDKPGGKVLKTYKKGSNLTVAKVKVYNGKLMGQGKKTGNWFYLTNTKEV